MGVGPLDMAAQVVSYTGVPGPEDNGGQNPAHVFRPCIFLESLHSNSAHQTMHPAAAAAAKSHQSCLTLCDPIDGTQQAPLSLGFSRQEYQSGLPFPSPMHESEK